MSESKARLAAEAQSLRQNRDEMFRKLARLLGYVYVMQMTHPDLDWPDLPDEYGETLWRHAA